MTIVTKQMTEKKTEKPLQKPLVTNDSTSTGQARHSHTVLDHVDDVEAWLTSSTRRRVSATTTVCVFITALLVMSIGIIGGVYLYRQFSRHQMARFRGWCGIPYDRESLHLFGGNPKLPLGGNPALFKGEDAAEWIPAEKLFNEEFDLDLEDGFFEEIRVPDFGLGRQGRFIHDFKANKTGIIDLSSRRCFVMPLDRRHVLPPRTLFDLIKKMWMGYYNVDTEIVRETMRVIYPPVSDLDSLGTYISRHCANYPTYQLERIYGHDVTKRSIDGVAPLEYIEFAGVKLMQLTLIDAGGSEVVA